MELSRLRSVYGYEGPFATVYLEGRSPGEDAGEQVRLRWKALRERLASQGAVGDALNALENALVGGEAGEQQTNGRVLVAAAAGVVLDEPWDAALGAGDDAYWTVVPELGPLVREEARSVRVLLAIVDQESAQVRQEVVAREHDTHELGTEEVSGGARGGVHKPRRQGMSHDRIQRRADHAVERNAEDIVAHLRTVHAHFRPNVLVLAGETQARTVVRDQLPGELSGIVVEAERGGTRDEASEQALSDQLREIANERSDRDTRERAEQLDAGLAHGQAVHGADEVARAAEMGAVGTLLFESGQEASREAMLIKTCAETDSHLDLLPNGTGLNDGVGALLRYPLNS